MNGKFILKGGSWANLVVRGKTYDVPDRLLDEFLRSGSWKTAGDIPKVKVKEKPKPEVEVKKEKPKVENIRLRCKC